MAVDDNLTISADGVMNADLSANDVGADSTAFVYDVMRNPSFNTPASSAWVFLQGGFQQSGAGLLTFVPALSSGGLRAGTVVNHTYFIATPIGVRSNNATVTITITPGGCVVHTQCLLEMDAGRGGYGVVGRHRWGW